MNVPPNLLTVMTALREHGIKSLLVGGCVRDSLLGITPKDYDVECYHTKYDTLVKVLTHFGPVSMVGVSYGVCILTFGIESYEFSIARTESKTGAGHQAFEVQHPDIDVDQAALRRDFTINSMAYDPFIDQIIDPTGMGVLDLNRHILRATSDHFGEDPLRVLRGMQFASRFNMLMDVDTVDTCRRLMREYHTLSVDRIRDEWMKWAKGIRPSYGIEELFLTGWMTLYPQLQSLVWLRQDPIWHQEGDVLVHTQMVVDYIAYRARIMAFSEEDIIVLVFAGLCHDMGKVSTTTTREDGRIISPGHDEAGVPLASAFMSSIALPNEIIAKVLPLVRYHMAAHENISKSALRRLSLKLAPANIELLAFLIEADHMSRGSASKMPDGVDKMRSMAQIEQIATTTVKPILLGRHLIELGFTPGVEMGQLLREAFDAQIEGEFTDVNGGQRWIVHHEVKE